MQESRFTIFIHHHACTCFVHHQADGGKKKGGGTKRRVDLDDLFPYVGEYGKYQKLLTWLVVLPACIPCGLQGFNQLFMADDLPHWCRLPQILYDRSNFSVDQLKRLALPLDPVCFDNSVHTHT